MKRAILLTIVTLIGLTIGSSLQTQASTAPDYLALISEKNKTMSSLLEDRSNMQETITFLHQHISETATFEMSMSNTTMPKDMLQQNIKMSKADYINTFIHGTHYVDDYEVSIETIAVQPANDGKSVISQEIMTEQGVALNPNDVKEAGKAFISTTKCITTHKIEGEKAVAVDAKCHTNTSFVNDI
ncbi:MAG: hypothetical protein GW903_00515 [Alphaproteobacteria bacterium]|nr:hypothetical protein [Alphaproteobacteria bacterium]NCQ87453.1 hypothetical protein [Alphaproteobacteria bacterium]NCT06324.1 hypothetical protein [Alphaproteobacteria bacterium]